MRGQAPPLSVEGLYLRRGRREVLHGIDVAFERGVVTAVVGPSGAGKTSLLRCLNRLEEPSSGRVLVNGLDANRIDSTELRRRVGMIFQTPVLFEGGVRANLCYGLDDPGDATLSQALELSGLPASFLHRESSALSVGQAQRVCIARALVRGPEVLLMDEPTSALDVHAASRIDRLAMSLASGDLTVVLVTHDLARAVSVAARAVLVMDGKIVARGAPDDVRRAWVGAAADD